METLYKKKKKKKCERKNEARNLFLFCFVTYRELLCSSYLGQNRQLRNKQGVGIPGGPTKDGIVEPLLVNHYKKKPPEEWVFHYINQRH